MLGVESSTEKSLSTGRVDRFLEAPPQVPPTPPFFHWVCTTSGRNWGLGIQPSVH